MDFTNAHEAKVLTRSSLFMKSKKGGFGLVLILNLDEVPALIRCLRLGTATNKWIRPEIAARSSTMGIVAINCLRIMLSDIPDISADSTGADEAMALGFVEDVMHTFSVVICTGGGPNRAELDEKRLRNYLKSVKGGK